MFLAKYVKMDLVCFFHMGLKSPGVHVFINRKYISSRKGKGQLLLSLWTGMVTDIKVEHVEKTAKLQFPRLQDGVGEIS